MKRIFKVIYLTFIVALIPFSLMNGQEKNSEKRIKVVVADGSSEKIVIDTVFNDDMMKDSIILKDGKVIVIGKNGETTNFISKGGSERLFVTVSGDGKDTEKKISIFSSDSTGQTIKKENENIFIYSNDDTGDDKSGMQHKVITWTEKDENGPGSKVIIMKDGKVIKNEDGESYIYTIKTDEFDNNQSDSERTKYVITRDGMVISIEGSDYTKVKELAKDIEGKLDANNKTEKESGEKE